MRLTEILKRMEIGLVIQKVKLTDSPKEKQTLMETVMG